MEREVNPNHIIAVLRQQRDALFNAMTAAEVEKVALAARVAELEAEVAKLNTPAAPSERLTEHSR